MKSYCDQEGKGSCNMTCGLCPQTSRIAMTRLSDDDDDEETARDIAKHSCRFRAKKNLLKNYCHKGKLCKKSCLKGKRIVVLLPITGYNSAPEPTCSSSIRKPDLLLYHIELWYFCLKMKCTTTYYSSCNSKDKNNYNGFFNIFPKKGTFA